MQRGSAAAVPILLSPRQREVYVLLGRGLSVKQIAASMGIASRTVRSHLETIYRRLDAHGSREALAHGPCWRCLMMHPPSACPDATGCDYADRTTPERLETDANGQEYVIMRNGQRRRVMGDA